MAHSAPSVSFHVIEIVFQYFSGVMAVPGPFSLSIYAFSIPLDIS